MSIPVLFLLPPSWVLAFLTVLSLGIIGVMVVRNYRSYKLQNAYERLARDWGLKCAFLHADNFKIYGVYQGYEVQIEPIPTHMSPFAQGGIQLVFSMINPNMKAFRVSKISSHEENWDKLFPIDHPLGNGKEFGNDLDVRSNDLFLSSLILSEDVKIDLGVLFNKISSGLFVIYGAEMKFLLPESSTRDLWKMALDVMVQVKEELKGV